MSIYNKNGSVTEIGKIYWKNNTMQEISKVLFKNNVGNVSEIWSSGIPLGNLPIGTLVKFNGVANDYFENKFIIIDQNHIGYPDNTTTLMTYYSSKSIYKSYPLFDSGEATSICLNNYYNIIPQNIKSSIVNTTVSYRFTPIYTQPVSVHIFPLGIYELFDDISINGQTHFNYFSTNQSRIRSHPTGTIFYPTYWTRDVYTTNYIYTVQGNGTASGKMPNEATWVVGAMNFKNSTNVLPLPDTDGFYILQE